jgi:hypothetical protein
MGLISQWMKFLIASMIPSQGRITSLFPYIVRCNAIIIYWKWTPLFWYKGGRNRKDPFSKKMAEQLKLDSQTMNHISHLFVSTAYYGHIGFSSWNLGTCIFDTTLNVVSRVQSKGLLGLLSVLFSSWNLGTCIFDTTLNVVSRVQSKGLLGLLSVLTSPPTTSKCVAWRSDRRILVYYLRLAWMGDQRPGVRTNATLSIFTVQNVHRC